jgi:hypothetical protein
MGSKVRRLVLASVAMSLVMAVPSTAVAGKRGIGSLSATPKSISFGKVAVGSGSTPTTFWISNDTKAVLFITSVSAPGGADADDFWAGRLTLNDCLDLALDGTPLYPGDTCGRAVSFGPTEGGRHTSSVVISLSDGVRDLTVTVPLSGTGI